MPKMPTGPANRLLPALRRAVLVRDTADRTDGQLLTAFLLERDGDAFAALVRRHGPMVLGVARRVIGEPHTADDAFQAVFLVLARRASAVRPREQVGNWLYGVAYRTAMKARAVLARRRSREKQVDPMPEPAQETRGRTAFGSPEWSDLQPLIDEELARLPDKMRLPVVLCDLEGRPQRAVAKHLGIAPATLAARLAAARRLLAGRLARRGVCLSGGALAVVLGERASAAMVAPTLAESTVRAAEAIAAGIGTSGLTGLVSAHAIQLCEGVMRMMLLTKLKTAGIATLVAFALTGGVGFGLMPAQAGDEPKTTQASPKRKPGESLPKATQPIDDATFLRRLCLDLTGTLPNRIEMAFFTSDTDKNKRAKVIDWLIADESVKAFLGKRFGVAVRTVRLIDAGDGRVRVLLMVEPAAEHTYWSVALAYSADGKTLGVQNAIDARVKAVAFAPDGKSLGEYLVDVSPSVKVREVVREVDTGKFLFGAADGIVVNERNFDLKPTRVNLNTHRIELAVEGQPNPPVVLYDFLDADPPVAAGQLLWLLEQPQPANEPVKVKVRLEVKESDADFLKRATQSARGSAPTPLEEKYFAEDKDAKKREKLLDLLLKDPAVAKKLGDDWKKKMLEPAAATQARYKVVQERLDIARTTYLELKPSKFEKLVDELIAAKKTDEQVLEAIALVAAGRLPTADEKKATLAVIGTLADKKAAWVAIAKALAPAK